MRLSTLAIAGLLAATPAQGDVGITMEIDGYSDLFKECEFSLYYEDFDAGYSKILLAYEVHIRGELMKNCRVTFEDGYANTECNGVPGVDDDHQCDELSKVRPTGVACWDAGGAETGCGTLKIRGPEVFTFD